MILFVGLGGNPQVAPEGVEVTVKVKFNEVDQALSNEPKTEEQQAFTLPALEKLPAPESFGVYKWFRGDLHLHTFHSDGKWTFPIIFAWANAVGLDFVGLTDHNTTSHHAEIDSLAPNYKNLLILRGEEITTYGGHFNVWGLPPDKLIDFRINPKDSEKLQKLIDGVHQLGLVASLNHPTLTCGGCDWSFGDWQKMDVVEIWNAKWDATDEEAVKKWDALLQNNQKIPVIGSSDTHNPPLGNPPPANGRPLGEPTSHVGMKNLSQIELLASVKQGRVWISDEANIYELNFSAQTNEKILNIGETEIAAKGSVKVLFKARNFPSDSVISLISNGKILASDIIKNVEYSFSRDFKIENNSYFRLEIRDSGGKMLALTNPIYIQANK